MTVEQITLFTLLFVIFGMLIWGRWRYDVVAFTALVIALVLGVVPAESAFDGFGHPATIVVALVLVISRGFSNSGVVEFIAAKVMDAKRSLPLHIGLMSVVAGALSAIMNNVAALALLMPVDVQGARKAKRSPALSLMPLSFASMLGGLVTLIGTPPNIIIATFRGRATGEPFAMFDFAPVGAACALAGIAFVALVGWRLIPKDRGSHDAAQELGELMDYVAELTVGEDAPVIGRTVSDWEDEFEDEEAQVLGMLRGGHRLPGRARGRTIGAGDVLIVEANPEAMEKIRAALGADDGDGNGGSGVFESGDLQMREMVVPTESYAAGRSPTRLVSILHRYGVSLMGVSRAGKRAVYRRGGSALKGGDILLAAGTPESLDELTHRLGLLPLAERGLQVIQRRKAGLAVVIFAAAIAAASFGFIGLPVALGAVVALFVVSNIVPPREVYDSVEWGVIVLLGALIPIGQALDSSGGTALIVDGLLAATQGAGPVVVLTVLMIITMTLSDVLNNTATAVIAAPIAVDTASRLGVSADPFLMAVAVAASCAFLTPIGHKNNTLIMGPGGYRFGDYWRMGLPLEILVIAVAVPTILVVWPF